MSRPSIRSCHAGTFSPVSRFGFASPSPPSRCHTWPETVWLRKMRNVRVDWPRSTTALPRAQSRETHGHDPLQRIVHLDSFPRHRPVQLALHLEQVPVHRALRRKLGLLRKPPGEVLVRDLPLPILRHRRKRRTTTRHSTGSRRRGKGMVERGRGTRGRMRGGVLGGRLVGLHGVRAQGFVVRARLERLFLRLSGRFAGRANERPSGEARGWEWVWVGERRPSTTSVDLQAPVDPLRTTTWQHSRTLTVLLKCTYHRDCNTQYVC